MIKIKVTALFIFFYFTFFQTYAQSEQDSIPLLSILNKLQDKFNCSFSYADSDINGIVLSSLPPENSDLKESITYLENNTSIIYTFLNPNNIVLSIKDIVICGILKSFIDKKPISNATIQTKDNIAISNESGEFELSITNLNDLIYVSYVGYKTKRILGEELTRTPCSTIILVPEVQNLSEIVLRNYLVKGINKKSDGSITINYNDFGILPGLIEPDLLQSIQALPSITSVEETVSDINVRGGTNDQNLILWDGIKMYQSGHFFGLISAFNPYLTKDIQVIKNGSSASYGDGVSSVISMTTSNQIHENFNASIGVNMISADGYIDTSLGKNSSLQLSMRKSINELIETPTYKRYFDKAFQDSEVVNNLENSFNTNNDFSFYDTSLRWLYQPTSKDLIKINALIIRNDLDFHENAIINQKKVSRRSTLQQNNSAGSIWHQRNWSTKFKSELLLYGTNYVLEGTNSDIINNQLLVQKNEVLENGVKLTSLFNINTNFNLKSGYQFNETGITNLRNINNPIFGETTKEVLRTNSVFSEGQFKSKNTSFNLGIRFNYLDKFKIFLAEPRLSFNHKFFNYFTLEALAELKSQVTSQIIQSQNDFLGIENRMWMLSNNDSIPIIKSQQVSLGLSYARNNWLISTDIYHKYVDGILSQSQGFQNQLEFKSDHGSYTIKGIDFLINKRFKKLSTWLSYSYAKNDYLFTMLADTAFPNNLDIRHTINFAVSYMTNRFKFSSGINWHSGKPTTIPVTGSNSIKEDGTINYKHPNSDIIKDYIRWDLSATYNFKLFNKNNGLLGLSIWNIVNQENIINKYYRINYQNTIEEVKQSGLEFTPNIIFRINL